MGLVAREWAWQQDHLHPAHRDTLARICFHVVDSDVRWVLMKPICWLAQRQNTTEKTMKRWLIAMETQKLVCCTRGGILVAKPAKFTGRAAKLARAVGGQNDQIDPVILSSSYGQNDQISPGLYKVLESKKKDLEMETPQTIEIRALAEQRHAEDVKRRDEWDRSAGEHEHNYACRGGSVCPYGPGKRPYLVGVEVWMARIQNERASA